MKSSDLPKSTALINNTKKNNTENESYLISSYPEEKEEMDEDMLTFRVRTQIDYDSLIVSNPYDQAFIDAVVELIKEVMVSNNEEIQIASTVMPIASVKSRFKKLKYSHIIYVLEAFHENHKRIKNIKKYLLAMLFNAPATMEGYYMAEIGYNMANSIT